MSRQKGLNFYKKKKKITGESVKEIYSWVFGIILSIFIAYVLTYFVGVTTSVVGESMEDELYNGQTVFLDRFSYIFSSPKENDVVAFLPNGNQNSHYYIKRIVAVPGDRVRITDGKLYVNDILREEDFDKMEKAGTAENEIFLRKGEYFVLGDNRNSSEDSRSLNIGPVKKEDISGRVWMKAGNGEGTFGLVK